MSDTEGSVFVDGVDGDQEEDSSSENQNQNQESTQETGQDEGSKDQESQTDSTLQNKDQEQDTKKVEYTEKGTKLAEDPLSRANQELANERLKIRQYEEVLNNPTLLKSYISQIEKPGETKKEDKTDDEPEMRVEDIKTTDDLQKYQRQQDSKLNAKIKELDDTIHAVKSENRDTAVAGRIQSDITAVRESYPELNPKDPAYNKELDNKVGELYEMYDYDTKTKTFKGLVSVKNIADKVMAVVGASKKQGSQEAQTVIKDKRTGKVVSGASNSAPDETSMTPGQVIASRIARARGNR